MNQIITIESYLSQKWTFHYKSGKEIVAHCIFHDCDKDSHGKEAHLYIDSTTGCYQCKKCLEQWNWITLLKHFWDDPNDLGLEWMIKSTGPETSPNECKKVILKEKDITKYQKALPQNIKEYLNTRGITDELINERQLWYGHFYGTNWITIPIRDIRWDIKFLKLRRDPYGPDWNKYIFYPKGNETMLYGAEKILKTSDYIIICEWEFDQMVLSKVWLHGITSTWGAGTFKEDWIEELSCISKIYVCFDNDEAWGRWSEKLINRLAIRFPEKEIYKINLPPEMGKDVTEFITNGWTANDIMSLHSELIRGTNLEKFKPMKSEDIIRILSLTIKHDNLNKLIVFLAMLSAYTEDSQFNILLNAPSSSGKSYIPLEVIKLFPEESAMKLLYVSQNAFFHDNGEYDKEKNEKHIRLDRKIIIFIDQPRTELLSRLRPILSHDEKIMVSKITDKSWEWWNRTKNVVIHGYPVAIFCTASTGLDEQEATRFLLLSPETHNEKFRDTIHAKIQSESKDNAYYETIENDPERILLMERIELIKNAHIEDICISNADEIEKRFLWNKQMLKPRHQRDIGRFISLIKTFALLNLPNRKRINNTLIAEQEDLEEAWNIWKEIAPGQEYNISPYAMQVYKDIIVPAYIGYNLYYNLGVEEARWVPRKYIIKKHSEIYGRTLSDATWRQELEPTLVNAWLLTIEKEGNTIILSPTEKLEWKKPYLL